MFAGLAGTGLQRRRGNGKAHATRFDGSRIRLSTNPAPSTTVMFHRGRGLQRAFQANEYPRAEPSRASSSLDKGYASKDNRDAARARGIAPVIPHKANEKNKPAFFARILYKARARIEQGVWRQALQARRATLRKDRTKLQINRKLCRRPWLDQIRPHCLAKPRPKKAFLRAEGTTPAPKPLGRRVRGCGLVVISPLRAQRCC